MFLYRAVCLSSPLRFTLFSHDRSVHYNINPASLGNILAMQQLRATTNSLTSAPPSIEVSHKRDQNHATAVGDSILEVKLCNSYSCTGIDMLSKLAANLVK